jgi:hypothetical protein
MVLTGKSGSVGTRRLPLFTWLTIAWSHHCVASQGVSETAGAEMVEGLLVVGTTQYLRCDSDGGMSSV